MLNRIAATIDKSLKIITLIQTKPLRYVNRHAKFIGWFSGWTRIEFYVWAMEINGNM
jgi:hypothetical protein